MNVRKSPSLPILFLFLINIIVGTGVFLNAGILYQILGTYSFLAYVITGFLVLPILLVAYKLAVLHPGKNMFHLFSYYFADNAFVFVPLYALSKLATAVIGILFCSRLLSSLFAALGFVLPVSVYFCVLFTIFFLLSYFHVSLNSGLQMAIIFLKLIPLLSIIFFMFFLKSGSGLSWCGHDALSDFNRLSFGAISQGAAITIFAFAGFESLFAISHFAIKRESKIGIAGLLLVGFLCAWSLYILYQSGVGLIGTFLGISREMPFDLFYTLGNYFKASVLSSGFISLMNVCVLASSFGLAHGIIYATINNFFASMGFYVKKVQYAQYIIFLFIVFYVYFWQSNVFILQQLSSLGTVITYLLFVFAYRADESHNRLLVLSSFFSVFVLLLFHLYTAYSFLGFDAYIIYSIYVFLFSMLKIGRKIKSKDIV